MTGDDRGRHFHTWPYFAISILLWLTGCGQHAPETQPWPWTPEVERFVEIYLEKGGQREIDWAGDDVTLSPEESLQKFEVIKGLEMELVLSEPDVRQPVDMHFDDRGRLWVVQYLQYPFPAGVTIRFYDQYLRAEYDGVPPPPPDHVRGADKITLFEDTNGDGLFDSGQDVITGLNMVTSVLFAYGGLWVMNPPYLLFYPDQNGDGFPDGDPEVHLEGFGLEDTHSLANALTMGPDGWIYGVHGSTSTAEVKGYSFLGQATWRYHPETYEFELFSEGGGNPWTMDFDSKGRAFTGTNAGNTRGIHEVQGGRYAKNWPKHGPLTTPYSFGYFNHMDHEGYTPRFSMTFVIYEEGQLPGYEGQLISGMALTNRMQASRLIPDRSTFRTTDTDALLLTNDRGFRPVDMKAGPDGAIYIADWCDIRMNHVHPPDTWDKSCGRIWRLQSADFQPVPPFNLTEWSNEELIDLLSDERKWYRSQARRLLGERKDQSVIPGLRKRVETHKGQTALEALWTVHLIEGLDPHWALDLLDHPDPYIRKWTVRLLGDQRSITPPLLEKWVQLAHYEPEAEVRSQLASSIRRLATEDALPVLQKLMTRSEDTDDQHIPLLIWWALEEMVNLDPDAVIDFLEEERQLWHYPLFREHLAWRLAKRFSWERGDQPAFSRINPNDNWIEYAYYPRMRLPNGKGDYTPWETNFTPGVSEVNLTRLAKILELAPSTTHAEILLKGVEAGLSQGPPVEQAPDVLMAVVNRWWNELESSENLVAVASLLGHTQAAERARLLLDQPGTAHIDRDRLESLVILDQGRKAYLMHCADCHQVDGSGMEGLAAPLNKSILLQDSPEHAIRVLLHGLQGEMYMPSMSTLPDDEISAIVSYIQNQWGGREGVVSPDKVEILRSEERNRPWTEAELLNRSDEDP